LPGRETYPVSGQHGHPRAWLAQRDLYLMTI
jgi:hypothetical protein